MTTKTKATQTTKATKTALQRPDQPALSALVEVTFEPPPHTEDAVGLAQRLKITSALGYQRAALLLQEVIKAPLKALDRAFDPIIARWEEGARHTRAIKATQAAPYRAAEKILKDKMAEWQRELERQASSERARIELAAREAAERARESEVARLLESGNVEDAQREANKDIVVVPPPAVTPRAKAEGTSIRKSWTWRVQDPQKVRREFLTLDNTAIGRVVRAMGPAAESLVGSGSIVIEEQLIVASRASAGEEE